MIVQEKTMVILTMWRPWLFVSWIPFFLEEKKELEILGKNVLSTQLWRDSSLSTRQFMMILAQSETASSSVWTVPGPRHTTTTPYQLFRGDLTNNSLIHHHSPTAYIFVYPTYLLTTIVSKEANVCILLTIKLQIYRQTEATFWGNWTDNFEETGN